MGKYGPATALVERMVSRAGSLTLDDAADIYQAHAARVLIQGSEAERLGLVRARRAAARAGQLGEYERARHAAASAWRHALPETQGPWLMVGAAIANAAGALAVEDALDDKLFNLLTGPWNQAIGTLAPNGPGTMAPVGPGLMIGRDLAETRAEVEAKEPRA
jgi:hypothetical protein